MGKLSILIGIVIFTVGIISLNHTVFADHFPIVGSIGEEVDASTGKVYVEKMEVKQISGGGKSVQIDFTFKSTVEGTWSPPVSLWELRDDKGNVHDPLDEWYSITPLPIGDISHGQIRFVIGNSVNPYVLTLRESVNFDSEVNIDVTKEAYPKQSIPVSELESRRNHVITNGDLELVILNEKIVSETPFTYNIEFSIKNISEKTNSVDNFLIKDEKGNVFKHDYYGKSSFDGRDIFPSHERKGNLTFELNNKPEKIMFIVYESKSNPIILHTGYYPISYSNKNSDTPNSKSDTTSSDEYTNKESLIPLWIKNNAGWWVDGKIDDNSFVQGIQFLIKEGIVKIPSTSEGSNSENNEIPPWIKNTTKFWVDSQISDNEFIGALQFLVKEGILIIPENENEIRKQDSKILLTNLFPIREDIGIKWTISENSGYENPYPDTIVKDMKYTDPTADGWFMPTVWVTIYQFKSYSDALITYENRLDELKEIGGFIEISIQRSLFESDKNCFGIESRNEDGSEFVSIRCVIDSHPFYVIVEASGDPWNFKTQEDNDWIPTTTEFLNIILNNIRKG